MFGLLAYDVVGIIGDWMLDHGKRIVGHTGYIGHDLGGFNKAVGDDCGGGDARFLGGDGVVQTARGTAASIANGRDDGLTRFHFGDHVVGRWSTGVGLFQPNDVGHAVL